MNGQLIDSPTWEALIPERYKLMMRLLPELQKTLWHLELRANVWERNGIKLDIKLKIYIAMLLPSLLYAFETNGVLGTDCTGTIKVAREQLIMKKRESVKRKRRERKTKTNGPPADSLTCSTYI